MGQSDQTTLEHIRLRRAQVDAPVARLRLSHLLSSASLKPAAMPPSAILLVRSMADPLPGRITAAFEPAALASAEWERAAQDSLGRFYGSAVRPMWGPAPLNAAAVLFADYGEMLACLARDLASGATLGWWWQSVLRRFPARLPGSWSVVWAEQPLYIPAALAYLQKGRQAVEVLERIAPVQAWNLLTMMLRAFHLPGFTLHGPTGFRTREAAVPGTRKPGESAPADAAAPSQEFGEESGTAAGDSSAAWFPWEPFVPGTSTPANLGYQRQALLGIGLLLHQTPQVAFTAEFEVRFRIWIKAAELGGQEAATDSSSINVSPDGPPGSEHAPERRSHLLNPKDERRPPPRDGDVPAAYAKSTRRHGDPAPAETDRQTADGVGSGRTKEENAGEIEAAAASTEPRRWESFEPTRAGGILYLIHFLRQAELMRHFDTGLGGWALLDLLGRCLLDDASSLDDDPIWGALAHLDGREPGDPPGSRLRPQRTYTAPESWENFAGPSRWARFRSRGTELWSEKGFLLLDSAGCERPPDGFRLLTGARRRELRSRVRVRPRSLTLSAELRRLLHFVLPYARWRLEDSLGGSSLQEALLRAGRLYVTATHVDLVMPLKEISVPVRLAGLDADPGWVPELGRVIHFHFTQEGYSHG